MSLSATNTAGSQQAPRAADGGGQDKGPVTGPFVSDAARPVATPKTYPIHPFADLFPPMTGEEFKGLVEDMRANGQTNPANLWRGTLLDGKHRQEACKQLGRELKVTEFNGTEEEALKFVISQNLHRRHLNPSQLGLVGADIANVKLGANQHTKEGGSIDLSSAAKMVGVSEKSVKRAKTVLASAAPDVVEQIRQGKVRVGAVTKEVLELPKDQQLNAINAESDPDPNIAYTNAENKLVKKLKLLKPDEVDVRAAATMTLLRKTVANLTDTSAKKAT